MSQQQVEGQRATTLGAFAFDSHLVDCAIWDLMVDYKKRNVHEICEAVRLQGYCGIVIDKRCKVLFAKKWFDRSGERSNTPAYKLKKSTKRPLPKGMLSWEEAAKQVKASGQESMGGFSVTALQSMSGSIRLSKKPRDYTPQVIERPQPTPIGEPMMPQTQPPIELLPSSVVAIAIDTTPHEGEPVKLSVWKLMSDYKPYTMERIQKAMPWVTPNTVIGVVWKMRVAGQVTTSNVPNSRTKLYTLRQGEPMPEGGMPYEPNVKHATVTTNTAQLELTETNEKETEMKSPAIASLTDAISGSPAIQRQHAADVQETPTQPTLKEVELNPKDVNQLDAVWSAATAGFGLHAEEIESFLGPLTKASTKLAESNSAILLDFSIRIKGKPVTREEAKTIALELIEAGFGDVDAESAPPTRFKMIEVAVRVMGMEFTPDEAHQLAADLIRNKFDA